MSKNQIPKMTNLKNQSLKNMRLIIIGILSAIVTIFLISFQTSYQPMLHFNNGDYQAEWKTIDSLEQQGLPKSALEKVLNLYEKVKAEENPSQIVKCLMYRGKYESQLEEDGLVNAIFKLENEIEQASFPVKPILQSVSAELYHSYLNKNRWQFQNRTQSFEWKAEDIRTWSIEQLIEKSGKLFEASLVDQKSRKVALIDFEAIVSEGINSEGLRPTLYDLLAHRAIDHFMNEQAHLSQPAFKFYLDQTDAFASAKEFTKFQFESKDSTSFKLRTLQLFQDLLEFRLDNNNAPALMDADLKRLKFVYDNSVLGDKFELYVAALNRLEKKYDGKEVAAEALAALAEAYLQKGQTYQPNPDDIGKWHWKEAMKIIELANEKYPESFGAMTCLGLKSSILKKEISLNAENVNLPNKPFLTLIEYRNIPKVYLKIIRFNKERTEKLNEIRAKRDAEKNVIKYLNELPIQKSWTYELPDDGDYRRHSVEVKMDELPLGQYMIVVADNERFSSNNGAVGLLTTNVSNLGLWYRRQNQKDDEFVVFNRQTGMPIENVTAEIWTRNYNAVFRKNEEKKSQTLLSDEDGFIKPKFSEKRHNFKLLLKQGADTLQLDEYFYNNNYKNQPQKYSTVHLFLDRAIYRPGQTIYFKGIALEMDENRMPSILSNQKVSVQFNDVNYQEVAKLDLTTNEYGTISGSFTAPQGGLLGSMSLNAMVSGRSSGSGFKSFRVEEYKRPKFEVDFEPVKESFKLNDEVLVKGFAKAYAGSNIDGAKVTYRVVREVRFPWIPYWYWHRGYNPWNSENMEIANGSTKTDEEGKFEIEFKALPDRSIPIDKKPEFKYTVYADVVDITGETHSDKTTVKVGTIALQAEMEVPDEINLNEFKKINISTKNLNGEFEPATGSFTIELLETPKHPLLKRYWQNPDNHILERNVFKRNFPNLAYGNEDAPQNWKIKKQIFAIDFDTEKSSEINLEYENFQPGKYAFTLKTKDKYGQSIEVKRFVNIFDLGSKRLTYSTIGWDYAEKKNYEPGEEFTVHIGTSESQLPLLYEVEHDGEIVDRKWEKFEDLSHVNFKVLEKHRGNFYVHLSYASKNRSFSSTKVATVPWSNKELSIEYGTFRDKLYPGQEEEWTLKIKGAKGEKIAAEMLAGMYDASLDAFAANTWGMNIFPTSRPQNAMGPRGFNYGQARFYQARNWQESYGSTSRSYESLNLFGLENSRLRYYLKNRVSGIAVESFAAQSAPNADQAQMMQRSAPMMADAAGDADIASYGNAEKKSNEPEFEEEINNAEPETKKDLSNVKVRTNLNETVFFFPKLMTDEEGNILLKFKMNEALTKWKFLGLAHTKDLQIGLTQKEIVTQKELMVMPNPPRFFRERDEIEYTAKVVNLTENTLSGNAELQLINPINSMPVYKWLDNPQFNQNFTVEGGQSARLAWRFKVPDVSEVQMIEHTVVAAAGDFSDAERSVAPVLSNRMMVTETKPLPVRGKEKKAFVFESFKNKNSKTLSHHALTLEFTSNPAWYAVQALPYLMEYPYECTEQIFSRYYANALATSVANSHPKVKSVFEKWRDYQPEAFMSNLSKNQELKSALLEETPWVLQAESEEQQKKNIALLFDLNRMSNEQEITLAKLAERQLANGGWSWFPGGRDSWYITQYVVEGMGHLDKLGVKEVTENQTTWRMIKDAVRFCDARMVEKYERLEKLVQAGKTTWENDHLDNMAIHYLYTRSFFLEDKSAQANANDDRSDKGKQYIALEGKANKVFEYYLEQSEKYWLKKGFYQEGMIVLSLHRMNQKTQAEKMVKSFKERSLNHEEMGMYWKHERGYHWYQLPIETHSLMIEVFEEVAKDAEAVNDLKIWLLKNKQTTHWKTTKATSAAVYALLMNGENWLLEDAPLEISFPNASNNILKNQIAAAQNSAEAGTGYFKTKIDGPDISNEMAKVVIRNTNSHPAWGAIYWQYFEDLDKITTFEETPLTLKKQLFKVENSPTGEVIRPIDGIDLQPGDKLKVRIELRVDREMEYVHMKDMRASGFEPMNVLSHYKWQGGLGYYESTRDASTNFFFSYLPKGTHVFEYPLRVIHKGDFSNGVTTIQSMYAPEFSSHSEGSRVVVE